jgi:hypothetical protein
MRWDELGQERRMVLYCFIFMFMTFAVVGFIMEQNTEVMKYGDRAFEENSAVEYSALSSASSNSKKLKAQVKGSIYETGSNMTVFGACFDGDSYLLPDADAYFTAWYPNGSIMSGPNATMEKIYDDFQGTAVNGTGRWYIHVTMPDTIGTYLTEMRCEYFGEWAVALGEWQNPEWVERIRASQELLQNISTNISDFRDDVNGNLSYIINNLDVSDNAQDFRELEASLRALDLNMWVLDDTNPFFVLNSGTHNLQAVDMLSPSDVVAASDDGYFLYWDGETWTEVNSTYQYKGVSVLPSNQIYAYVVGTNGSDPIISINGANATVPSLPSGSPTALNDVAVFLQPNDPSGDYYVYLLGNDGTVYLSNDSGGSYSTVGSVDSGVKGRFSEIVENYDQYAQVDGYVVIAGQGDTLMWTDGVNVSTYNVSGTINDVGLLYYDYGYAVVEDVSDTKIYKFNGTGFELEYTIEDPQIVPTGLEILTRNDVWVTTTDPSTFYHFDGRNWKYSTIGYGDAVMVLVSFDGGANTSISGIQDVTLIDGRHGYAVGQDGIILKFESESQTKLDNLLDAVFNISVDLQPVLDAINSTNATIHLKLDAINQTLTLGIDEIEAMIVDVNQTMLLQFAETNDKISEINLTVNELYSIAQGNFTIINQKLDAIQANQTIQNLYLADINTTLYNFQNLTLDELQDIYSLILSVNATMNSRFDDIDDFLSTMNSTIQLSLDNIESNVTFTNLYLQTTLFPLINGTYYNVLEILGIVQENQVILNQTRDIVNETAGDVDELVNRSRRIRAWVTQ